MLYGNPKLTPAQHRRINCGRSSQPWGGSRRAASGTPRLSSGLDISAGVAALCREPGHTRRLLSLTMPRKREFTWVPRIDRKHPAHYLKPDAVWPRGPLVPDAPREAHLARQIAENLDYFIRDSNPDKELHKTKAETVEKIAKVTEMSRETIYNIRDGLTWPDFLTIARLEIYFNHRLWGYQHRRPP